jgi:hypothetical protein
VSSETAEERQRTWHQHQPRQASGNGRAVRVPYVVADRSCGCPERRRRIDGGSGTMLSRRLSDPERTGFVRQSIRPSTPPRERYEPTPASERVARFPTGTASITAVTEAANGPQPDPT